MNYSLLHLYKYYGQFGNVVNVTLKNGTESFEKYGDNITGVFVYSSVQRRYFQNQIDNEIQIEEHGKIRFKYLLSKIGQHEKYDLLFEGINTIDILSIASIPSSNNNDYTRQEIRQLPEPTIIRFNARNFDEVNAMLYLYQSLSGMGSLTPFEIEQNAAYKIIHNNYEIPDEIRESEFYNKETGVISSGVEYHILKYRYRQGILTADEDRSFWALTKANTEAASEVLMKELNRGNNNKKYSFDEYKEILRYIPSLIAAFQEERLSYTKVPVWWNLERYLHILLGHVSILQIGEYFRGKTPFQYELHDIKDVVKNVLSELSEQINLHFDKFPQKDFTRHSGMAHYYRGDYYVVRIRPDGLLMQFYKDSKTPVSHPPSK